MLLNSATALTPIKKCVTSSCRTALWSLLGGTSAYQNKKKKHTLLVRLEDKQSQDTVVHRMK